VAGIQGEGGEQRRRGEEESFHREVNQYGPRICGATSFL
jgi:hypothetical protein